MISCLLKCQVSERVHLTAQVSHDDSDQLWFVVKIIISLRGSVLPLAHTHGAHILYT